MTTDLVAYFEYKDSGLPWLGRIPAHWSCEKAKWLLTKKQRPVNLGDGVVTCFRDGVVTLREKRRTRGFTNALKEIGYQGVRQGDLVIHAMDAFAGAVGVSDSAGKCSPVYAVCDASRPLHLQYIAYTVREMARSRWIVALARGIRERSTDFRYEQLGAQPIPLPPLAEQAAIVRYLKHKDRQISRYIRNRQKLIKVLTEQKQAIISQAVTKGLAPSVPMKPSGVDWLGDIPAHWEVRKLKYLVRNVNEQTSTRQPDEVYIALEHVEGWTGRINLPSEPAEFDSQVKRFSAGDVLFGKLRPYLAKVTRPDRSGVCVGEFLVLRGTDEGILHEFLEQQLRSKRFIDIINSSTFGAKMPRADWTFIGNLLIVYPPTHGEQLRIIKEIVQRTAMIQAAIDKSKLEIDLVRELHTRLIADVVTGKVDVRDVAPMEDIADEPDALEADQFGDGDENESSDSEESEVDCDS